MGGNEVKVIFFFFNGKHLKFQDTLMWCDAKSECQPGKSEKEWDCNIYAALTSLQHLCL